jgi:hypothetical protein
LWKYNDNRRVLYLWILRGEFVLTRLSWT